MERDRDTRERVTTPWHSSLMGWIGNAQIGPIYLGFYLLACVFMTFYKIDKEYHSSILSELEVIREKKSLQDDT